MPHVIRCPAKFIAEVVWIGGEATGSVSVALRFRQSIIDVETHVSTKAAD